MEKVDFSDRINSLFEQEKWTEARALLEPELRKSPDSHWLLDRLSVTYYEQEDYRKAFTLIKKAFVIAPHCPLVLWDYAGACAALGRPKEAIKKYDALIEMYPDKFHEDECGEDMNWASSLVLDCFFRLGTCFQALNADHLAMSFFDDYIELRKKHKGLASLYSIADATKRKAMIAHANKTKTAHGQRGIPGIVAKIERQESFLSEIKRAHKILAECP